MAFYRKFNNSAAKENKATGSWTIDANGSTAQVTYTANRTGLFVTTVDEKGEKSFNKWISREHFTQLVSKAAEILKAFDEAEGLQKAEPTKEKSTTVSPTASIAASMQQMMAAQAERADQQNAMMMQMMAAMMENMKAGKK